MTGYSGNIEKETTENDNFHKADTMVDTEYYYTPK